MKILVVEDEKDLRESLVEGLRLTGYAVDSCGDGETADELIYIQTYDLIILDLNLPKIDGIEILKNVRKNNKQLNVLILSARCELEDKINGLDYGANDYMTKPFQFEELLARIRSLLRRKTVIENTLLICGDISFNTLSRTVFVNKNEVGLTAKETSILEYLLLNKQRIINQEELIEHVWDSSVDLFSNSVRMHISSLRRKLRSVLEYDPIQNIIGQGYIIKEKNNEN